MLADLRSVAGQSESWQTLALIADPNDAALTQSGVSAVVAAVYDVSSPGTASTNLWVAAQPAVSAVFYNTLQTDSGWSRTPGFNFKHIVNPVDLSGAMNGGHTYAAVYTITTILHGVRVLRHFVTVKSW